MEEDIAVNFASTVFQTLLLTPQPSVDTLSHLLPRPQVQMKNLCCKCSAQSWASFPLRLLFCVITNDLKHFFHYYLSIRIFKKYTIILCTSTSEEERKLMCVRLKWYHLGNWQSLNYPRKKWRKKGQRKQALMFSQNKMNYASLVSLSACIWNCPSLPWLYLRAGLGLGAGTRTTILKEHCGLCSKQNLTAGTRVTVSGQVVSAYGISLGLFTPPRTLEQLRSVPIWTNLGNPFLSLIIKIRLLSGLFLIQVPLLIK